MCRKVIYVVIILVLVSPAQVFGSIVLSEIMYAPNEGVAHEWFEIFNNGANEVDITDWRFNDGSNHVFGEPPKNGGQGSLIISSGTYAIVAKEADTFLSAHSGFSDTVIDGSFSLTDTGDSLSLIDSEGIVVDTVSYDENAGAKKNELSLQLIDGVWTPSTPTPGSGVLSIPQEEEVQEEQNDESSTSSSSSSSSFPVEQQIFAFGGDDRAVTVGASSLFKGRAIGLSGEPLSGARYIWSFGDGGREEGESVLYHYRYPSEYIVVLEVASGEYSATDRVIVSALPAQITITNADIDKIELSNQSDRELNLSWWMFKVGVDTFIIPENTILLPEQSVIFSSEVTGLYPNRISDVSFMYPNGSAVSLEESLREVPKEVFEVQQNQISQQSIVGKELSVVYSSTNDSKVVIEKNEGVKESSQIASVAESISMKNEYSYMYWLALGSIIVLGSISAIVLRRKSRYEITIIE